ncbi:MAG: Na(+)/H(+) antiporter subunit B [Syntrophomonadaceae bacterium]
MSEKEMADDLVTDEQNSQIIRKTLVKKLIAFIQLYALYIIIFGELGPGGGFQGGVILGSSIIIYILIFGLEEGRKRISQKASDLFSSTGALIYGGVGLLAILFGGHFLQYSALPLGEPAVANHYGIMAVEIGIGITVAATMIILFCEMIGRD